MIKLAYKLALDAEHESKAKFGFKDLDKILAQEGYKATFTLKNVGDKDFPGGLFNLRVKYESELSHLNPLKVPEIKKGEEKTLEPVERTALAKGFGSFFGKIIAADEEEVIIIAHDQEFPPKRSEKNSIYDIPIKERTDVYTYYMLLISMASLVILASLSGLRFIIDFLL